MSVTVQPLADYVVAQVEAAATKTAGGLYLPQAAAEKPKVAKVIAVGELVRRVKIGDRILYKSFSSNDFKVGADEFLLVKEEDILATVKEAKTAQRTADKPQPPVIGH